MKTVVISIVETSPDVWRVTFDGAVLGDSFGYARHTAETEAWKRASVPDAGEWQGSTWVPIEYQVVFPA